MQCRLKTKTVNAVQWQPGSATPGVRDPVWRQIVSRDKAYYYYDFPGLRPRYWFSTAKSPGLVPLERRNDALHGWLQVVPADGAPAYHRKMLDFTWWEVKTDPECDKGRVDFTSDDWKDYASQHGWTGQELGIGLLPERGLIVRPGDWLVTPVGGDVSVMSPEAFGEAYEPEDYEEHG